MVQIIDSMETITELSIGFCEAFPDEVLKKLKEKIEYSQSIEKLTLKKGLQFSSQAIRQLF